MSRKSKQPEAVELEFKEPRDEFPSTMAKAIVSVIVAVIIGCILGDSVSAFFGLNMDYEVTNRYAERYSATLTWFENDMVPMTDETGMQMYDENGDPVLAVYFQRVGQAITGQDGTIILRSADGDPVVVLDGAVMSAEEAYGEELGGYLESLFELPDCFEDEIDSMTDEPIDDVYLYNIAVVDTTVIFYVFYDDYGFMAITYDPTESMEENDNTVALTSAPGWYIQYVCDLDMRDS